jgi:uncharacterized membrane protein YfcA
VNFPAWLPPNFDYALLVVLAGGFVRGFTGFGANMVMAPLFTLFMDPIEAVVISIILDFVAGLPLVGTAVRHSRWQSIIWIVGFTILLFPLGLYLLVLADKDLMRRIIAIVLIFGSLILLSGWRFKGGRTTAGDIGCGALSGLIQGSTSMGGFPFVLYFFAQGRSGEETRASAFSMSLIAGAFAIIILLIAGILTWDLMWLALLLIPLTLAALWLGVRTFRIVNDESFRHAALAMLLVIGVSVLIFG